MKTQLSAEYGYTEPTSYEFTQTLVIHVPASYESTVYAEQPMDRFYGDFTVTVGNTTYILKDVYFDYPDTSELSGSYRVYG